jgi:hypothetical protein
MVMVFIGLFDPHAAPISTDPWSRTVAGQEQ